MEAPTVRNQTPLAKKGGKPSRKECYAKYMDDLEKLEKCLKEAAGGE